MRYLRKAEDDMTESGVVVRAAEKRTGFLITLQEFENKKLLTK